LLLDCADRSNFIDPPILPRLVTDFFIMAGGKLVGSKPPKV
jgi:hypothetical protein